MMQAGQRVRWVTLLATVACAAILGSCSKALMPAASRGVEIGIEGPRRELEIQRVRLAELLGGEEPRALATALEPVWVRSFLSDARVFDARRAALGRELFFEPRLSVDGTVACATCHDVRRAFTEGRAVSVGVGGQVGRRNAPTVINAALLPALFWDGRAASLEEQAKLPITNPVEMGQPNGEAAVSAIAALPRYRRAFSNAYGRRPNLEDLLDALASFERSLILLDSPFDRFLSEGPEALTETERKGHALFTGKALCTVCHHLTPSNPLLTDHQFHNLGVSARGVDFDQLASHSLFAATRIISLEEISHLALGTELSRLGRFLFSREQADLGAFRTPPLRQIGVTAPYMHDGSMETLWDVVDFYNQGGLRNRYLDETIQPLGLSAEEVDEIVAFLFALTSQKFAEENRRELERQRALAAIRRPFRLR